MNKLVDVHPPKRGSIFFDPPLHWQVRRKLLDSMFDLYRESFESRAACDAYFAFVVTPRSGSWTFLSNGKTATTSALGLLYWLEFGHENTAVVDDPRDINSDAIAHRLSSYSVFRFLPDRGDLGQVDEFLNRSVIVATVRHPSERAVSGFRYLCKSHRLRHQQFAAERARMSAAVGFDWDRDCDSSDGFLRFLDYLALCIESQPVHMINNHWIPQWNTLRPDVLPIDVLGRTEAFPEFCRTLTARLRPDLGEVDPPVRYLNSQPKQEDDTGRAWIDRAADQLWRCYAKDFEAFDYTP